MIVRRRIVQHLKTMLEKFPVVSLTGPRQSGKTTLLRNDFSEYKYFNLERIDIREMVSADPIGFLKEAGPGVIFDEAQNLPSLFSWLQVVSDERRMNGQYILSGSQSFLLNSQISQSLAGRVSVNVLLPFDTNELLAYGENDPSRLIINGFYPRIYDQQILPDDFYPSYLQTYIERDIRTLRAIENLRTFSGFLGLCAGRMGQLLNLTSLANDAGISVNTAKAWLSLLEASYIIFLLQPYHRNFNKRIIKAPKLYFYDTGVASSLLRIQDPAMLSGHYLVGALFENLVISELIKSAVHQGKRPLIWYWRESNGREIDCIIESEGNRIDAIEIKAGQTFNTDYLKNLKSFPDLSAGNAIRKTVIYRGADSTISGNIGVLTWEDFVRKRLDDS